MLALCHRVSTSVTRCQSRLSFLTTTHWEFYIAFSLFWAILLDFIKKCVTLHQKLTIKCVIYPQNLAIKCVQFMKKSARKRVNTYKGPSLFFPSWQHGCHQLGRVLLMAKAKRRHHKDPSQWCTNPAAITPKMPSKQPFLHFSRGTLVQFCHFSRRTLLLAFYHRQNLSYYRM